MIEARLIVRFQFDKDEDGNAREEDWGIHQWVALPSPGDVASVIHDYDVNALSVVRVRHFPFDPTASGSELHSSKKAPVAHVIADYQGIS